jgi:hypothetical protein
MRLAEFTGPKSNLLPVGQIYPYLLRNLEIERPNQIWARLAQGFVGRSRMEWQREGMDIT